MAKLCALLVLALACVVRAVRIDPPSLVRPGKYIAHQLLIKHDDPICTQGNGLYAHPSDCTRYLACRDGRSQERECPEGFKFDSLRHCTPEEDADCGNRQAPDDGSAGPVSCPKTYGVFPDPEDCHKYLVCINDEPRVRKCPEGMHYQNNVGCVHGEKCPQLQTEESKVCRKADGLYRHENCLRFYKCVNFKPQVKRCPSGKAFDSRKETCTKEQFAHCKRNDVQDILRPE